MKLNYFMSLNILIVAKLCFVLKLRCLLLWLLYSCLMLLLKMTMTWSLFTPGVLRPNRPKTPQHRLPATVKVDGISECGYGILGRVGRKTSEANNVEGKRSSKKQLNGSIRYWDELLPCRRC